MKGFQLKLKITARIDVDGNNRNGAGTRNSSFSDLLLPPETNIIKIIKLYWGAKVTDTSYNLDVTANRSVKIRKDCL